MPTVSKAQLQCVNKYIKNNYDDIKLRVKKGQRELIQVYAKSKGESVSALICRLLSNEMGVEIGGVLKTTDNTNNNL